MTASDRAAILEGNRLEDGGDVQGARRVYERAVEAAPDAWRAWINLGNALRGLGLFGEAAERYRRAIAIHPDSAGAHQNLGSALLAVGDATDAAVAYRDAIRLKPDAVEAWLGLGSALETEEPSEAIEAFERALTLDASHPMAAAMLARLLVKQGESDDAERVIDAALRRDPRNVPVLIARADLEKELGHGAAAAAAYRQALAVEPDNTDTWNAYLFALNLDEQADAATILAEHVKFGDMLSARVPSERARPAREPRKRLRIGYLSPDFRRHSVSCFIEPLLRHHDRSSVEVHCYYNHAARDEITQRFIRLADGWHDIVAFDDATVAQRIVDDGIDILVDLAGHTTGNRRRFRGLRASQFRQITRRRALMCLCDATRTTHRGALAGETRSGAAPNAQWCADARHRPSTLARRRTGVRQRSASEAESDAKLAVAERRMAGTFDARAARLPHRANSNDACRGTYASTRARYPVTARRRPAMRC